MAKVPSIDEVVETVTGSWSRPGSVTGGFRSGSARALDQEIEVAFRWRRDPARYLIRFRFPGWFDDVLGDAFDASDAVRELGFWLMEELDTGFVGRAERRPLGDGVLLVDRPCVHGGWFVGAVPLRISPGTLRAAQEAMERTGERFAVVGAHGDPEEAIILPGRHLDRDGLDGAAGRAAVASGSLIAWLQLDRGDGWSPRAGQAVVTRIDCATARIARLELRTDDPRARDDLVLAACRAAVEAGCELLVADRDLDLLIGFGSTNDGERIIARFDEVRAPA